MYTFDSVNICNVYIPGSAKCNGVMFWLRAREKKVDDADSCSSVNVTGMSAASAIISGARSPGATEIAG